MGIKSWANPKSRYSHEVLLKLFVLVIMANGLIANFAPSIGINAGTLCIDACVLALLFFATIKESSSKEVYKCLFPDVSLALILVLIAFLTLCSVLAVGCFWPGVLSDLRIRFLYYVIPFSLFVLVEDEGVETILEFIVNCGTFFCLFAIAQAIFPSYLDSRLLAVDYDGTLGLTWSELTGSLVLRSNALMGNAIEFGGVCVMLFTIAVSDVMVKGFTPFRIFRIVSIAGGCYFSYSRVACAALVVIGAVLFFRLNRTAGIAKAAEFLIITLAVTVGLYLLIGNSALAERFLGSDEFTMSSNEAHLRNTISALNVIAEHPVFGTGLGTQLVSESRATGDGWWMQLAAETGIFVFALYVCFFVIVGKRLWESQKSGAGVEEQLAVILLVLLFYYFGASLINSSFAGRADLTLFFVLLGIWMSSSDLWKRSVSKDSNGYGSSFVRHQHIW